MFNWEINILFHFVFSSNPLSITIPDIEFLTHTIPPPKLGIAEQTKMDVSLNNSPRECSAVALINDDIEQASICETASVASDLTRMCVSDEDEKSVLASDDEHNR